MTATRATVPASADIRLKRIHAPAAEEDGFRVLVDRLWPRGISKVRADLALWCKEAAPSTELRRWFGHAPDRWAEFQERYRAELRANAAALAPLRDLGQRGPVTLLYAARDERHNEAVVLRDFLLGEPDGTPSQEGPAGLRDGVAAQGRRHPQPRIHR